MPKSTFIIIEQSYLIRKGLTSLIEKIPNTQVVQQFENFNELNLGKDLEVDFIIVNAVLFDAKFSQKKLKKSQIIIISNNTDQISNNFEANKIIELADSQNVILKKLNNLIGNKDSDKPKLNKPEEISKREADIVRNVALGYSNKEIADKLFISAHTVVTHRKNITRKLGIKTVPGLTIYAILNKLIDINEAE